MTAIDEGDTGLVARGKLNQNDLSLADLLNPPSAYIYHDATGTIVTPLVQNVASEIDINSGIGKDLEQFTNASNDGSLVYTGLRDCKVEIEWDMTFRSAGSAFNGEITNRINGVATEAGEYIRARFLSTATDSASSSRIVDITNGDVISTYIENQDNNADINLFSATCTITLVRYL